MLDLHTSCIEMQEIALNSDHNPFVPFEHHCALPLSALSVQYLVYSKQHLLNSSSVKTTFHLFAGIQQLFSKYLLPFIYLFFLSLYLFLRSALIFPLGLYLKGQVTYLKKKKKSLNVIILSFNPHIVPNIFQFFFFFLFLWITKSEFLKSIQQLARSKMTKAP